MSRFRLTRNPDHLVGFSIFWDRLDKTLRIGFLFWAVHIYMWTWSYRLKRRGGALIKQRLKEGAFNRVALKNTLPPPHIGPENITETPDQEMSTKMREALEIYPESWCLYKQTGVPHSVDTRTLYLLGRLYRMYELGFQKCFACRSSSVEPEGAKIEGADLWSPERSIGWNVYFLESGEHYKHCFDSEETAVETIAELYAHGHEAYGQYGNKFLTVDNIKK